jgi:predicted MFS family arabinose efflux permease
VAFTEELQSGGPILASADLAREMGLSATWLAAALFVVPLGLGVLVEPAILVATERFDRRRVLRASLLAMSVTQVAVLAAPGAVTLTAAMTAWGIAAGITASTAEVALVAEAPDGGDRVMARWALLGVLGDLGAPILYWLLAVVGLPWRGALLVNAGVSLLQALWIGALPVADTPGDDEEEEEPWRVAVRALARSPEVWGWLAAAAACTLLDEIFVSFGALWLRSHGADAATQGLALALFSAGSAVGLFATDRALTRWSPHAVVIAACVAFGAIYPLWLFAPAPWSHLAGFALGATVGPMWPIATARAYAASNRPALVAALANLFGPFEVLAPLLVGLTADHFGLAAAMTLLVLQPIAVAVVAMWSRRSRPS